MVLPRPPVSLKGRALRCLSAREHSRAELVRKLARHEEVPGELDSVLDDLQAKGFISQERVVASVLNRSADHLGAARVRQELQSKGIEIEFTADAVDWIAEHGHQPEFGARPLRRSIQRVVDDKIADMLLDDLLEEGGSITVAVDEGELVFS